MRHCTPRAWRPVALPIAALALSAMLAMLAILAAGCSAPSDTGADSPLVVSAYVGSASPRSLSMIGKNDRGGEIFAVQLTDSLVQYDADMNLVPRLAESWTFSDDRRVLTFALRPGVRWHDGQPLTADDVVFSAELARNPEAENRAFASDLEGINSVEAADASTVRVEYTEARPGSLAVWRLPIIPRHLAESADGGVDRLLGEFADAPVGCGPFRFVSHDRDHEIVLQANDDYWDGRPAIDRLALKIYADQRTAFQALMDGELQLITVTPEWFARAVEGPEADRFDSFVYFSLNTRYIAWNQRHEAGIFDDPRVRRALVMALDRRTFNERVVGGVAEEGVTPFHPLSRWTDPSLRPWPYDPEAARALLDEAGWRDDDGDGVREKDGVALRFTLIYPNSSQALAHSLASWQQQSWQEVGAAVEINRLEWNAFLERRKSGDFGVATGSLGFTPNPDDAYGLLHSSSRENGMNFFGFEDAEIDRLLDAARETFDDESRRAIYFELQQRLHELEPLSIPFYFPSPVVHDRRLKGVTPTQIDFWRSTAGPRVWRWEEDGD